MEWELRIIFAVIGIIIIGYVVFDGMRRNKKRKGSFSDVNSKSTLSNNDDTVVRKDSEGFDAFGIGQVRTFQHSATNDQDDSRYSNDTSSFDDTIPNHRDDSSNQLNQSESESLVASRDDHIVAEDIRHTSQEQPVEQEYYTEEPEIILSVVLLASEDNAFNGHQLLQLLLQNGCRFGKMDIFHRFKDASQTQHYFSIANAFNPGVFDLNTIENESFKGITFFMTVPGSHDPEVAYETMITIARTLKQELNGQLIDSSRSTFTDQTFRHELEKIKDIKRRALARQ